MSLQQTGEPRVLNVEERTVSECRHRYCCWALFVIVIMLMGFIVSERSLLTWNAKDLETVQLLSVAAEHGYKLQVHKARAADGVELQMFRLPRPGGHPVLLQHGVLDSAWMWVISKEFKPVAFQLRDAGYDVWLGNNRGNCFSTPQDARNAASSFWDFSFEDMGRFDVPAQIDTVLAETGRQKLSYIGHSQGTTQFFIAAQLPEIKEALAEKVDMFLALSPIAYLGNTSSYLLKLIVDMYGDDLLSEFPVNSAVLMDSKALVDAEHFFCTVSYGEICKLGMATVVGSGLDSTTSITAYLEHFPLGTSAKDIVHFSQLIRSGRFQRFDYGTAGNMNLYGTAEPPDYDLSELNIPTGFFFGRDDAWAVKADAMRLLSQVKSHNVIFNKLYPRFSHATWQIGKKEAAYWIEDLLDVLQLGSQPQGLGGSELLGRERQGDLIVYCQLLSAMGLLTVMAGLVFWTGKHYSLTRRLREPLLRTFDPADV